MFPAPSSASGTTVEPARRRLEIFVDGTNFEIASKPLTGGHLVDIPHLARLLTERIPPAGVGHLLVKLRYCTAPAPWARGREFEDRYFTYLRSASSVDLILGRHALRSKPGEPRRYEEKETDVNIAIRLVAGAYEDRYDVALVVSGDTDMAPAMKMARGLGKTIVWGPLPEHTDRVALRKVCDAVLVLDEPLLKECKHFKIERGG